MDNKVAGGRNLIILSDGTGQRGGVFFDEARTNIYKLYRATRPAPDSAVPPAKQLAFYDPGLGTQATSGGTLTRTWRRFYNLVSQATGLGITRNIIDCYTAVIQLWRPGDRIFLIGFSRGAYTVRCLATALCYCGIPTHRANGRPLFLDEASARKLATEAVKTVYQHVSSPRDEQFFEQRKALAAEYRKRYSCSTDQSAYPFFVGVFDTVAALSNRGSLTVLLSGYVVLVALIAAGLEAAFGESAAYWAAWLVFDTVCLAAAAYVYTHFKFAFSLPEFHWWETVHLTTFRQQFYDQDLNDNIGYARHAISIDERRADFARVRWGRPKAWITRRKMQRFEQLWFAGNHADIGGGYPENEARLSDIALKWMVEAASDKLGDEGLIIDRAVLNLNPSPDGMQHDETRSLAFRFAGKSDRDPVRDATLHPSVAQRFNNADGVLQYDVVAEYRPEALRGHSAFAAAYANIPLPYQTCMQAISAQWRKWKRSWLRRDFLRMDGIFLMLKGMMMDRIVSCLALLLLAVACVAGAGILGYQLLSWLQTGVWPPMPLAVVLSGIRGFGASWLGLQLIYDWILALPLSICLLFAGFLVFWGGGVLSAYLYRKAARAAQRTVTPAQTVA
jgi:uncharacterized protein (DUF2235 family)